MFLEPWVILCSFISQLLNSTSWVSAINTISQTWLQICRYSCRYCAYFLITEYFNLVSKTIAFSGTAIQHDNTDE